MFRPMLEGAAMYGLGILKGLGVTIRHFIDTYVDEVKYAGRKYLRQENFAERQGLRGMGAFTVQYPEEKLAVPERFRFVPFLVVEDPDHPERPGHDWCTSCGICAKVCPPQCIWIVRSEDPVTKRPVPEPQAFFIDIDICMNCGFCAEFCPFDAIKMDHDYELASYDRTGHHIHDKERLSKPFSYWLSIAPTTAWEEAEERGGWQHTDVIKEKKKQGVTVAPVSVGYEAAVGKVKGAAGAAATAVAEAPVVDQVDEEALAAERLARRLEALARKRAKDAARGV
ncbi:4Fe-4S dicluster domain-containing protein [Anaerolineae bacterium CFX9]|nr:4Fe-4S dicluster domain-containing protein [Anaerolineae bacterium CFX9]